MFANQVSNGSDTSARTLAAIGELAASWTWYPFNERSLNFDTSNFPVPVDLIVYTQEGWQTLSERSPKFHQTLHKGSVWIYESKR
jgi:hypothetical protein